MDRIVSTKDLKSKLDRKQLTVVETLAPERYREAHIPGALNIPPEQIKELAPQLQVWSRSACPLSLPGVDRPALKVRTRGALPELPQRASVA